MSPMCFKPILQIFGSIYLSLFFLSLHAQNLIVDSLEARLEESISDIEYIETLLELSNKIRNQDVNKSVEYARTAINMATNNRMPKELAYSNLTLSKGFKLKGLVDSALVLSTQSYEYAMSSKDSFLLADALSSMAVYLSNMDKKSEALDFFHRSIEISTNNKFNILLIDTYNSFGTYHMGTRDEVKAVEYFNKALYLAEEENDENLMAKEMINLSIAFDDPDTSLFLLNKAESLALKNDNTRALTFVYDMQAYYHYYENNLPEAIRVSKLSLSLAQKIGDSQKENQIRVSLAKYYQEVGKLDSAAYYYESFFEISDSVQNFHHSDIQAMRDFSYTKHLQGKYNEAYAMLDSSYTLVYDLYGRNLKEEVSGAQVKYETKEKEALLAEKELALIKNRGQKNRITWSLISLLLAAAGLFFWFNERQKRKTNELSIDLRKKELEAQKLQELDDLKKHFFTNITHELRTPLSLIIGPLSSAQEKISDDKSKEYISLAKSNAHRLLEMVNEIMDLSKIENGHIEVVKDSVHVNSFFKRNLYSFQSSSELRNIDFEFESTFSDDMMTLIDVEKTETILNNLISNAIKFSPEGETIGMKLKQIQSGIRIELQDNGSGIAQADRLYVFDRFYQSPTNQGSSVKGSGIGLSLSKSLAQIMEGELKLEDSERGSLFVLSLPCLFKERKENESQEELDLKLEPAIAYEALYINGEKPHILVIEDNDEMRNFLQDILSETYRVTTAMDGYDGLQKIQSTAFDLISCDVMMPKLDGFGLREKINENKFLNKVPFIFLTARSLEEDRLKGLRLGVDDYLIKPFVKQEYLARIHNLIVNKLSREEASITFGESHKKGDDEVLLQLEKAVLDKIDDPVFKVNELAQSLHYSQRQLTRIIKSKTGMTPVQFILELRLQRAYHLLQRKEYDSIKEIRYAVGIDSPSYFTRKFKERFGLNASEV